MAEPKTDAHPGFYKTVITLTVLSEGPIPSEADISEIAYQVSQGDWSGEWSSISEQVSVQQMRRLCLEQQTDPEFFKSKNRPM